MRWPILFLVFLVFGVLTTLATANEVIGIDDRGVDAVLSTALSARSDTSNARTVKAASANAFPASSGPTVNSVPDARFARLSKGFNLSNWLQSAGSVAPVTETEMRQMRQNGVSSVRLPFNPALFDSSSQSQASINAMLAAMDSAIDRLISNDLAVVLDAHSTDSGISLKSEDAIIRFMQMWSMLAARYAHRNPEYLMFEVMNEPGNEFTPQAWGEIQNRVVSAIRAAAPQHTIVVTPINWSSTTAILGMPLVPDSNLVYTVHFYEPMEFTHQGATWVSGAPWLANFSGLDYPSYLPAVQALLASTSNTDASAAIQRYVAGRWDAPHLLRVFENVAGWAKHNGVRVWLGEFGAHLWPSPTQTTPPIPVDARMRWLKDVRIAAEQYGIGWCMWNFKSDFGYINTHNGTYIPDEQVLTALGLKEGSINEAPPSPYAFSAMLTVYSDVAIAAADSAPSPSRAEGMAAADLTGNGHVDMVVTHISWPPLVDRPIELMLNNGDGTFYNGNHLIDGTIPQVRFVSRIISADFNRSGRKGFLFLEKGSPNTAGGQSKLLIYDGNGHYVDASANLPQQLAHSVNADAANISGNSPDLIVFNDWGGGMQQTKSMQFMVNDGSGRYTIDQSRLPADLVDPNLGLHIFTAGKFIGRDNLPKDLVVFGNQTQTTNWFLKNDGKGHFTKGSPLPPKPLNNNAYAVSVVSDDVNRDGRPDLIVAYLNGATFTDSALQVLIGNGDGTFRDETAAIIPQPTFSQPVRQLHLSPITASGKNDLLVEFSGSSPILMINNGGVFSNASEQDGPPAMSWNWIVIPADIDKNGAIDLLVGAQAGQAQAVFGEKWFNLAGFPSAPTIGAALAGNASATVTFSASSNADQAIILYTARSSPGSVTGSCNAPCTSIKVNGLVNGTAYTFTVKASNSIGNGPSSAPSNSATPNLPGQTVTFGAIPHVFVGRSGTLSATATSGLPVTFSSLTTAICSVSGNTVIGMGVGICMIAANQAGNSNYRPAPQVTKSLTITILTPPGPPTILSIDAGNGRATVNFSPVLNTGGLPIVTYTATCTASGQPTRTGNGSHSPITLRNLSGNVAYQCTVTATNGGGLTSATSAFAFVTPAAGKKDSMAPIMMLLH